MAETTKVRTGKKWQPILLVQIYRMARLGFTDVDICRSLKVTQKTFWMWKKERAELREALGMASRELSENESLPAWIYSRLSPELREVWNKIRKWEKGKNGVAKIEMILQDHGKRVRQQLFLFALCVSHFSPSVAMQKVNITKRDLDGWIENDAEFALLVDEVQWHKANFFEEALVQLVQEGNPAAVIFANKSFNAKRGYESKARVDVNVSGQVMHGVFDLSELLPYLADATRLELLEAIRKREAEKAPRPLTVIESLTHRIAEVANGSGEVPG